jgi:hypothetical protein
LNSSAPILAFIAIPSSGGTEVAKVLLVHGADPEKISDYDGNAIKLMEDEGRIEFADILCEIRRSRDA